MKKVNIYDVRSGELKTLNLTSSIETLYSDEMPRILQDNGYDGFDNKLIITEKPLENWLQEGGLNAIPQTTKEVNIPTPPIPKPTSPNDFLPTESNKLIISSKPISNLKLRAKLPVIKNHHLYINSDTRGIYPPFPTNDVRLQFSTYWKQIASAVITGEQVYTKGVSYTHGMSNTNSETLSAEVGVAYSALSAKISDTVGHSVTISNEVTIKDTYNIKVPEGETTVYALWQLVEEYLFVDPNGNPINYNGNIDKITVILPNEPRRNDTIQVASDRTDFKS